MSGRFMSLPALAIGLSCLLVAGAQARDLEVGKDKEYKMPSDAIGAAKAGDTVKIYPGEYFDCATVRAKNLTIEGIGDADKILMTDKACSGKGMLVITGNDVTVKNLTLTRARVPDGNGAGIRNEAPNLTVDHVLFVNNQNGILSTSQEPGIVTVLNSVFDRNGGCANSGGCAHGLYVGVTNLLHVENSTFTGTKNGHHIKSRALRTEVIGCTITDGEEGTASYEVEVPIGGSLVVKNNTMEKGPEAENHSAMIIIGAEGVSQPTREITIENNTARNDGDFNTIFVKNITATDAILKGNKLSGPIKPLDGDGKVTR
jgi:hypothetical protein